MTLRLVSDNNQPDGVLYCQQLCYPRKAATILVSFCGGPYLPRCDECARGTYQRHPDVTRLAPLSEYVDHYAIAREAALATPEQIIGQATGQTWPASDLDEQCWAVCQRIARNQVIYCYGRPCLLSGQFTTPANVLIRVSWADFSGQPWTSLCNTCLGSHQADGWRPEEIRPADDNDAKSSILQMANRAVPAPRKPVSRRARIIGLSTLGGLTLGTVMVTIAGKAISDFDLASQTWEHNPPAHPSYADALQRWGIFFIVVAILTGVIWLCVEVARQNPAKPKPAQAAPSYRGVPAAQGYQQGIPVGQLAATAAVVGGEILWHRQIREHQARVRDSALGDAPLNNVHAGIKHATAILVQQKQQYQQQQQCQPDSLQPPFTSTSVSDIYGNATYRPRPWL
jgi:hypothetical protein